MKTEKLIDFFEKKEKQSTNTTQKNIYRSFVNILSNLKEKDLTDKQRGKLEDKIAAFNFTEVPENEIKQLKQKRYKFLRYLKKSFHFVPKGYFTQFGISVGVVLGTAIGMTAGIIFNSALGLISGMLLGALIGITVGLLIGRIKDNYAEKQSRVIHY